MVDEMRAAGAPAEEIDRWQREAAQAQEQVSGEVFPLDCRRAVELFLAVDTQWRTHVAGSQLVWLGLDYAGVEVALKRLGMTPTPAEFADLQVMEREAIVALAQR